MFAEKFSTLLNKNRICCFVRFYISNGYEIGTIWGKGMEIAYKKNSLTEPGNGRLFRGYFLVQGPLIILWGALMRTVCQRPRLTVLFNVYILTCGFKFLSYG